MTMASTRSYRLLCPIARALDRIGDRWTLLILRDLLAGPARFSDLQTGLTGIAANLLTSRLQQLVDDGLVEKVDGDFGVILYQLTEQGEKTRNILFELALFGGQFEPDEKPKKPGNLRTVAVILGEACRRVVTSDMSFTAQLDIDGELFVLTVAEGHADIVCGSANKPDLVFQTSYEPMMAVVDQSIDLQVFVDEHVTLDVKTSGKDQECLQLLGDAVVLLGH